VLGFPLIHPQLLAALASAGHGGRILIADANLLPTIGYIIPRAD
jgi:L-fucose mutarotase/ribose pyranase (RbsD/FucU family)